MIHTITPAPATVHIDFLYSEDCPSHERALTLLHDVIAEQGITADLHIQQIETEEEADEHRFPGSPTIRVAGRDILDSPNLQYGLSCRAYMNNGRISPLPPRDAIVNALRATKGNS